jgi:hypothetical protein
MLEQSQAQAPDYEGYISRMLRVRRGSLLSPLARLEFHNLSNTPWYPFIQNYFADLHSVTTTK